MIEIFIGPYCKMRNFTLVEQSTKTTFFYGFQLKSLSLFWMTFSDEEISDYHLKIIQFFSFKLVGFVGLVELVGLVG